MAQFKIDYNRSYITKVIRSENVCFKQIPILIKSLTY